MELKNFGDLVEWSISIMSVMKNWKDLNNQRKQ